MRKPCCVCKQFSTEVCERSTDGCPARKTCVLFVELNADEGKEFEVIVCSKFVRN